MPKRASKGDPEAEALQRERRALAEVPPRAFVAERKARARALKEAGFASAAKTIEGERKPSPSVWALNALARKRDAALSELIDRAEAVRRTQRRAVSGGGADELRAAQRAFHDAVARALKSAVALLREHKESSAAAVQDRMRDTLLAAATGGDAVRAALREGTLEEDVGAAGFGFVSPFEVLDGGAAPDAKAERKAQRDEAEREEKARAAAAQKLHGRELERARSALAEAEEKLALQEKNAAAAEEQARLARERAREAKAAVARARAELKRLER